MDVVVGGQVIIGRTVLHHEHERGRFDNGGACGRVPYRYEAAERLEILVREVPARRRMLAQHRDAIEADELVRTCTHPDRNAGLRRLPDAGLPVGMVLLREVALEVDPNDLLAGYRLDGRHRLEQPELVRSHERVN